MSEEFKVAIIKRGDRDNLYLRCTDPDTGRLRHKSAGTSSPRKAERAAADWQAELREGRYRADCRMLWDDFRERYETEVLEGKADGTYKKVTGVFNTVEALIAPQRLRDLAPQRLSLYQSKLRDKGSSENTIKSHLSALKSALNWAVKMNILHAAPRICMPTRAKPSKLMKGRPITLEEFERLLAKVPQIVGTKRWKKNADGKWIGKVVSEERVESWRHLLRGLWASGLRLAESLELTWDDCDDRLSVRLDGERSMLRIPAALEKGNEDRLLPMAPEFVEFLLETPEAERVGYVFKPAIERTERSLRLRKAQVGRAISAIGKVALVKVSDKPVKFASAHDLRRSFGDRWASRLMPRELTELMRHDSIETTMKYYAGRNARSTSVILWRAHKSERRGNQSGNQAENRTTDDCEEQSETHNTTNT